MVAERKNLIPHWSLYAEITSVPAITATTSRYHGKSHTVVTDRMPRVDPQEGCDNSH